MAIDEEDVGPFNGGSTLDIRLRCTVGEVDLVQAGNKPKLSNGGFGRCECPYIKGIHTRAHDIIVSLVVISRKQ